jgi:cation diffusion facilitator family transporter
MRDPRCVRCARRAPWVSLVGNACLAVFKLAVGALGGSSALIVDGTHSLTDVVGSTAIIVASRVSGRPADESHPYGHGKAEFLGSAAVYSMLLVLSAGIVFGAVVVVIRGSAEAPHFLTLFGAIVSVLGNYVMYMFAHCAGTKANSPAILADAFENRADALSSIAAVAGIACALFIHPVCDPIAALIVGAMILWNCLTQLKSAISNLIDRGLPTEVTHAIRRVVMTHQGVLAIDYVRTRQTGPQYWVDVGVRLSKQLDVAQSDAIASAIRGDLMRRCEQFQHVEVFVVPWDDRHGPEPRHLDQLALAVSHGLTRSNPLKET